MIRTAVLSVLITWTLIGCGTVKEKTAPCRRPAMLSSYAQEPPHNCGPMRPVNDPALAFATIGIEEGK